MCFKTQQPFPCKIEGERTEGVMEFLYLFVLASGDLRGVPDGKTGTVDFRDANHQTGWILLSYLTVC